MVGRGRARASPPVIDQRGRSGPPSWTFAKRARQNASERGCGWDFFPVRSRPSYLTAEARGGRHEEGPPGGRFGYPPRPSSLFLVFVIAHVVFSPLGGSNLVRPTIGSWILSVGQFLGHRRKHYAIFDRVLIVLDVRGRQVHTVYFTPKE